MNNLARLDDRRQLAAPTQPLSLPPSIASTLADSAYRLEPWNAREALVGIVSTTGRQEVVQAADDVRNALQPCNRDWLKKRLASMALAFGHERDPDRVSAWLAETGRLLFDLPQDILADAIDEAIKRSDRGFMPAVGQIRAIADPLFAARRQQSARLDTMAGIIRRQDAGGTDANVVRPWERPAERPAPDKDLIPADQIDAFNRNMRKFGLTMRCAPDGTTFTLEPGAPDVGVAT